MHSNTGELDKKIENNLRFIITISIFFLTIFSESRLAGSVIVVGYIISYIAFQFRTTSLSLRHLKWIDTSLLIGIGSYVAPLALMALSTQNSPISQWEMWIWQAAIFMSMLLIMCIPAVTLVMILFLSDKT